MSISLRDVLLNIEDTTFATLAAMSSTIRIEDETSPDDECLSPTESESAEFPHSKTGTFNYIYICKQSFLRKKKCINKSYIT